MAPYRRFARQWLGACLLLAGSIALLNRLVDPFDYYRDTAVAGLNDVKPKAHRYERAVKPAILRRLAPELVILGSSYAEIGFNPDGPTLQGRHAYNFALAGAPWGLVYCHALYALETPSVRHLVIGIHPEDMPSVDCSQEGYGVQQTGVAQRLLSFPALTASLATLTSKRGQRSYTANGLFFYYRDKPGADRRFRHDLAQMACGPANASSSPPDLAGLRAVLEKADARGAGVALVFYPHHASYFETLFRCPKAEDALWQRVEAITRRTGAFPRASLWLFYDYNGYTLEEPGTGTMRFWQDPSHFNHEYGEAMLAQMFSTGETEPVGLRLEVGGLSAARERFRRMRQRALDANPALFRRLAQPAPPPSAPNH